MSTEYDPIKFDFQDCDSFLASLDNEDDPPSSTVYHSQEYMNNAGIYDKPQFKTVNGPEWNGERSFAFNTTTRESYAMSNVPANREFVETDGNSFDLRDSSSNSSPLSGAVSVSSASDFDTLSNGQYANMSRMTTHPITPPDIPNAQKITTNNRRASTNIPVKTEQVTHAGLKSELPKKTAVSANGNIKAGRVTKRRKEKTSHNMIEKKYRTNINDKILALRDCVPALRCVVSGNRREDLDGLTPASKLNKATVLTKATEYIMHLQSRNNVLTQEVEMLKARLGSTAGPAFKPEMNMALNPGNIAPPGYQGQNFEAYPQQTSNGGVIPKVMMCSMAGLMGTGMMVENNNGSRGLSSFPVFAMFSNFHVGPLDFSKFLFGLKLVLIIGAVVYAISPSFFSRPPRGKLVQQPLMSSLQLRKQTWFMTSQYLRVPSTDIFDSMFSLLMTMLEVMVCSLVGLSKYKTLKNTFSCRFSFEDTVEAVVRASDSQLCGGDEQCTDSRILATFLQGFLTKASPMRYMIQALQLKVLSLGGSIPKDAACYFAENLWSHACRASENQTDDLPPHLRALLAQKDVLHDTESIKKLRNLAFGLPVTYGCKFTEPLITSTSDDHGIYSSCDALASWYSLELIQDALVKSISYGESKEIGEKLSLAIKTCPPNTDAYQYVLTSRALILGDKHPESIQEAQKCISESVEHYRMEQSMLLQEEEFETMSTDSDDSSEDTALEENHQDTDSISTVPETSSTPVDIKVGILGSFVLHFLSSGQMDEALNLVRKAKLDLNAPIGLLSFVSLYKILKELRGQIPTDFYKDLEPFAAICRLWIGSDHAGKVGIELEKRRELVGELVKLSILYSGLDMDEGYMSSS